jgi:hypothetical protein
MMKKVLLTLLAFMVTVAMNAEQISKQQALQKAQQFMPGKQFGEARSFARSAGSSEREPFYVFNADGNQGFVIVSGDDRTTEILGYSNTGTLDMEQLPENLKWWLDSYAHQIEALGTSAKPAKKAKTRGADSWAAVDPLIKTKWDQDYPYNMMCPDWTGKDWRDAGFDTGHLMTNDQDKYHCVTGCVAAAMAQVIYYWKCLDDCPAITGYKTSTYGWTMKALPATTFKWAQMQKTYSGDETGASAEAVAELFRYCGQAVEMDYNLGGSSASITPADMANYFGFSNNAKLVIRSMYSSSEWENMIYKDISENRPVLYGGSSMSGGHQFIVDGYDGNGLFHMNWGWGGMSDGYFVLSLANPDELGAGGGTSTDGYSMDQHAIIGLKPGTAGEVEIPQFYGKFKGNLVNSEFSRVSANEDFTDVVFPGLVFFQYENTDQTDGYTFETGWGLYKDGSLLQVLGVSEPVTLDFINSNAVLNSPTISFGKDLDDGRYQFRQMYRLQGSTEWQLCKTPYDYYGSPTITFIEAVVSGNNLTLRKSEPDEYTSKITVNSVSFYPTSLEYGKPVEVTVNLTNNGDSYQELVYLSLGSQKTVVCGSVEAGQTGNVKLHLTPAQVGTMTLKISTDYYASNEVWSEQVTVEAAKPQLLSAMATTPGLVNNVLTGTTLKVNAVVKNDGSNTYENGIELLLCKITWEDPKTGSYGYSYDKTKSVMTTILPGETKEVNFEVKDLDLDGKYFYSIWYYSENMGVELIPAETSFILKEEPVDPEEPEDTPISGDADGNGKVEAADIDAVVKYIMEGDFEGFNFKNADLNGDDKVDAADLVLLINMVKP